MHQITPGTMRAAWLGEAWRREAWRRVAPRAHAIHACSASSAMPGTSHCINYRVRQRLVRRYTSQMKHCDDLSHFFLNSFQRGRAHLCSLLRTAWGTARNIHQPYKQDVPVCPAPNLTPPKNPAYLPFRLCLCVCLAVASSLSSLFPVPATTRLLHIQCMITTWLLQGGPEIILLSTIHPRHSIATFSTLPNLLQFPLKLFITFLQ